MTRPDAPLPALAVLAEAFRAKRTGQLVLGQGAPALHVRLEAGQIVALGPAAREASAASLPRPDDSVRLRLERVLEEIGIIAPVAGAPAPATAPHPETLRERLLARLADDREVARFEAEDQGAGAPALVPAAVATEPLILEAVRQLRHDEAVRGALGDLDRRLVATGALADERTLTLTEGYLLSRIDGLVSARQVLQLVPLDPSETERTLLGLMLTGRVECRPGLAPGHTRVRPPDSVQPLAGTAIPAARPAPHGPRVVAPGAPQASAPPGASAPSVASDGVDEGETGSPTLPESGSPPPVAAAAAPDDVPAAPQAPEPPDPVLIARRREVLELFQALPLKNHFEVLGVEPGCDDAAVRGAYAVLAKRYHPDAQRDPRLADLHDILEAIFIRVGEAWEVLGEAKSRASYEARSGLVRRAPAPAAPAASAPAAAPGTAPGAQPPHPPRPYVPPEETLNEARQLIAQARYWDAILVLEPALPGMEPRSQQHRGRLLLARAYAKNPKWLRRAEETLQEIVREDPTNADAHYELGLVYKSGGFAARAQGMFRRALELRPGHKEASAELGIQEPAEDAGRGGGGLLRRLFKRGQAS